MPNDQSFDDVALLPYKEIWWIFDWCSDSLASTKMTSRDEQRFVAAFIEFLKQKLRNSSENGPDPESLEGKPFCICLFV